MIERGFTYYQTRERSGVRAVLKRTLVFLVVVLDSFQLDRFPYVLRWDARPWHEEVRVKVGGESRMDEA